MASIKSEVTIRANFTGREDTMSDEGWYVSAFYKGRWRIASRRFARQKDAEAAVAALVREGLTTAADLRKAGRNKFLKIMAEAMQW